LRLPSCPWRRAIHELFFHFADRGNAEGFPRSARIASSDAALYPQLARIGAAAVLGIAAILKFHSLRSDPSTLLLSSSQILLEILHVQFEAFMAVWLAAGFCRCAARTTATLTFGAYGLVAFNDYLAGSDSCGCFGGAVVHPLIVFFGDVAIMTMLLFSAVEPEHVGGIERFGLPVATALLIGAASAYFVVANPAIRAGFEARGNAVFLAPVEWEGKDFPLFPYLDKGAPLRRGYWTVFLVRGNCGACHLAVQQAVSNPSGHGQICVLEISSHASAGTWPAEVLRVHLKTAKAIVVATPTVIEMSEGRVVSARQVLLK